MPEDIMPEDHNPIFATLKPIILASASPRRQKMLKNLGLKFKIQPCTKPEPKPESSEKPGNYAKRLATAKARSIFDHNKTAVVIGADTIVVQDNNIMGKPENEEQALKMLTNLAGRSHQVISACTVLSPAEPVHSFVCKTKVIMSPQNINTLRAYIATGEPADKAGAYGVQGQGSFLIKRIEGSYTNVVGLPLAQLINYLLSSGAIGNL